MRGPVSAEAAGFAQRAGITLVSLDLLVASGIHRSEVRIGDDDLVSESFEVAGDALALGRGFDEDACSRALSEDLIKTRSRRLDAAF